MSAGSVIVTQELTLMNCECGMTYAVPEKWRLQKTRDQTTFYCPGCGPRSYRGESDIQRAQREKREAETRLQAQINEERVARLAAERSAQTETRKRRKIEKRIAAGVCPCCNRQFDDLHRHMTTKHKEYALTSSAQKQITAAVSQ